ncbi:hypothetical protein QR680_002394 [Steinernema hermaphroditum]|uniref:poly(A)-specific ribonuclease n=1 Tax=Steinernema hermaphroditum TaxID=289476 RepID=A0AA39LI14_9BILA|nr:hypothetical protein QR680_002394 [Steinernema hermaphroditum]
MTDHDSLAPGPSSDNQSNASSSESSSETPTPVNNSDRKRIANGMLRPFKFLSSEEVEQGCTTDWREIVIHGNVKNLNPNLYNFRNLTALFLCKNNLSQLSANVVKLRNLQILDLSFNKIRTLPSQIGDMSQLQQLHLNNNLLRTIPYEIGKLKQLEILNLSDNPLTGEFARLYSSGLDVARFLQFMTSHLSSQCGPPPDRHWVQRDMDHNPYCHSWNNFTVLSYNILCPSYATENAFGYCPSWSLDWNYRKSIILKDIIRFEPDIIALQEVETEQFSVYFCPKLEEYGYSGVFAQKTRAKTMDVQESNRVDGCALFWRKSKFIYEDHKVVEFASLAIKNSNGNEHMLNRVMPKDNVAIACVLQMKGDNMNPKGQHAPEVAYTPMVICNTHMHWDPTYCDVKLIQSMILTKAVTDIVHNVARLFQQSVEEIPLIICGDFNSLPDSGVYEYFTNGFVTRAHHELKGFNDEKVMSTINNVIDDTFCGHGLSLESAIDVNHIPYTNNTQGVIDYIFGTSHSLLRLGFLGPIDQDWVYHNKIIGFPHAHIPSDHLPIMCHYALIPRNFQNNGNRPNSHNDYHNNFTLFS